MTGRKNEDFCRLATRGKWDEVYNMLDRGEAEIDDYGQVRGPRRRMAVGTWRGCARR